MRPIALCLAAFALVLGASCKDKGDPPPIDAPDMDGPDAPPAAACSTTTAYLVDCTTNADCQSCLCKTFGHNMYCSQACTTAADCPAPSTGCVGSLCRRP